jgi:hypothetical protein
MSATVSASVAVRVQIAARVSVCGAPRCKPPGRAWCHTDCIIPHGVGTALPHEAMDRLMRSRSLVRSLPVAPPLHQMATRRRAEESTP